VLEKDVVLSMALLLAEEVKSKLGWDVVLTRNDDTFIPLEERTALANKVGADLFVSLHVNASPNSAAHGVETYYLNFSKNEQAAKVAARENGTTLRAVSDLEQILFDLMAHSKIQESSRLASDIQHALITGLSREFGEVKNLGVKQGPFYVLLGANMPSVLVEAAFLSNPAEETRLATRKYQVETTRAIIDGLRAYDGSSQVVAQQ
jgi:N-acetylmuramoyl-L-alanine amidase